MKLPGFLVRPFKIAFALALALAVAVVVRVPAQAATKDPRFFSIQVLDDATQRGVPLVELKTVNHVSWWTDSAGFVAFDEPGVMGQDVFFHVQSPGYEHPQDGFKFRGVKLRPIAGGHATIKLKRRQISERLCRLTGQGIYRESVLLGERPPLRQPVLNGQVMGQDTVIATPYRGKLYWFWGDTERASYPLGNFGASGATSELPGRGGLKPESGVDFTYFVDATGFSRPMCPDSQFGSGLKWIESVMTVREAGRERLVARLAAGTGMQTTREWHLAQFNDQAGAFESLVKWDRHDMHDSAHPFHATVDGTDWIYLFPDLRVRATLPDLRDLARYEAFTCVAGDGKLRGDDTAIERDAAGRARYQWKPDADRIAPGEVRKWLKTGKLTASESWLSLQDLESGRAVELSRSSVYWNAYRQRWVKIAAGIPGEVWFSEADTPTGPWLYARKVAEHGRYNFYNPTQHPFFDEEGGRVIYFEGTYTDSFSGAPAKTPRYDYNQILYRLALDDVRVTVPSPVYRTAAGTLLLREGVEEANAWAAVREAVYCAVPPDRRHEGLVPIWSAAGHVTTNAPAPGVPPLFFAEPAANEKTPNTLPLHDAEGRVIARVWRYPLSILPLDWKARPIAMPGEARP